MKYEWRKQDKLIYLPKEVPSLVNVPKWSYLTVNGTGNPNSEAFKELVEALYAYSYAIRMLPKKGIEPAGYFEYTVFPLEGFWTLEKAPKKNEIIDKDQLIYQLMIRQPDFVTKELIVSLKEQVAKKVSLPILEKLRFEEIEEGQNLQMLHIGSYDNEIDSFKQMEEYCKEHHLVRTGVGHKEIYLSDPRRVAPEKQKTVLRFPVKKLEA